MKKKEQKERIKKAQDNLQKVARDILENPPEIEIEEKLACEHKKFIQLSAKSIWYQCEECGVVFALLDVISYRSKWDMLKDFSNVIDNYKDNK